MQHVDEWFYRLHSLDRQSFVECIHELHPASSSFFRLFSTLEYQAVTKPGPGAEAPPSRPPPEDWKNRGRPNGLEAKPESPQKPPNGDQFWVQSERKKIWQDYP